MVDATRDAPSVKMDVHPASLAPRLAGRGLGMGRLGRVGRAVAAHSPVEHAVKCRVKRPVTRSPVKRSVERSAVIRPVKRPVRRARSNPVQPHLNVTPM